MDREDVIAFLRFLAQATEEEIEAARKKYEALQAKLSPRSDVAADIRFCLRQIDQELVARSEIHSLRKK